MEIRDLGLPKGVIVAVIQRGKDTLVPRGDVKLQAGDTLVLGAESFGDDKHIDLKEVLLRKQNPWNGQRIRELDISRQTIIIMVKRKGKVLIPNGELTLLEGDRLIMYTQMRLDHANNIEV
jgi:voltage-gated potassium channel